MADRPLIVPNTNKPLINAVSTGASITGPATVIKQLPGISYGIVWTGTTLGTFSVQVSNDVLFDAQGNEISGSGHWDTLPPSSFTGTLPAPAGTPDHGFIDVLGTEAFAIRLLYNRTSGTGTLTVFPAAKVW